MVSMELDEPERALRMPSHLSRAAHANKIRLGVQTSIAFWMKRARTRIELRKRGAPALASGRHAGSSGGTETPRLTRNNCNEVKSPATAGLFTFAFDIPIVRNGQNLFLSLRIARTFVRSDALRRVRKRELHRL